MCGEKSFVRDWAGDFACLELKLVKRNNMVPSLINGNWVALGGREVYIHVFTTAFLSGRKRRRP